MPSPGPASTGPDRLRELGAEAEATASADPESARALATWVIDHADDPLALVRSYRALGVVERTLKHAPEMESAFAEAVSIASRAGLSEERAFSEVLLASAQQIGGRTPQALETLARAIPDLDGERRLLAQIQLGIVRGQAGDYTGGLETLDPLAERIETLSPARRAIFHTNRATCLLQTNRAAEAIDALDRALVIYEDVGEHHLASNALHNLARAYAADGQVVGALRCFERVDALGIGPASGVDLVDRASVFLSAGLLEEAEDAAARAREAAVLGGSEEWHPIACMILAEALEALGDIIAAIEPAREAMELFERQGRPNLRDLAEAVELRCVAASRGGQDVADRTRTTAARLAEWGAVSDALTLLLGVARRSADDDEVRVHLDAALAIDAVGVEPELLLAEAAARRAVLDGDTDAMSAIVAEAFTSLDEWRRTIGSTELQAGVSRQGVHLADVGIGVAARRGDAGAALDTIERLRALSLVSTIDRPRNEELDRHLVEYRALGGHLERGDHQPERARLERRIRELGRLADRPSKAGDRPGLDHALAALGDRRLVEFVDHRGSILAIVAAADSPVGMIEVATVSAVRQEIDSLRSAVTRLASNQISTASREAFTTVLNASARYLSDWLFGQIDLGDAASLVVVPSRSLGSLPWAALPALAHRVFTVAPSLRSWAAMSTRPGTGQDERVVAVGLDDPPAAAAEARTVAGLRRGTAIVGEEARADVVLRAIDGAGVAHLACHGVFRGDNPLMSSLHMADGPITVYDLEQLSAPPGTLVLSACEVAQSQRLAGDALLGMTASLMAAGTRSIIAATTVVSDAAAPEFMAAWHRRHAEGASPAEALAHARATAGDDPTARSVAASFLCLGV